MRVRVLMSIGLTVVALAATAVAAAAASEADGHYIEPGVRVLQTWHGQHGSFYGWAVSELGDVTGDGVTESMIGDPFRSPRSAGRVDVENSATGKIVYRLRGRPGAFFGYALADAGDANGDGVHDIVVGAPGGKGYVTLFSGATGKRLHTWRGNGDFFGGAVSSAGDVNGDGHADILVGARGATDAGPSSGISYVYSGRTHHLLLTLHAEAAGDLFGSGAGFTADVTGDGVPDEIVGARDAGPGMGGRAYVFSGADGSLVCSITAPPSGGDLGSFFVSGVGDVNGDGRPDIYVGDYDDTLIDPVNGIARGRAAVYDGATCQEIHAWTGSSDSAGMGPGRYAGDVDGDGHPDLVVGSYTASDGAPMAGKVQVFSGLTGDLLRTITSTRANENLGFDAVGVGDVDGDGVPDMLVSAASGDTVYLIAGTR